MTDADDADAGRDFPETVRWHDGAIEVIDQTLLPASLEVRRLTTVDAAIDAIRRLVVRGAPAIGGCGGLAMVLGLEEARPRTVEAARATLASLADRIGAARPTAVNLAWAVERVRMVASAGASVAEIHRLAAEEADAIIAADREACRLIGEHGRAALAGRTTLLTICNTGRLATLGWGTALGIVYARKAAGEPVRVYACETRPLLQGARLTAWELRRAGVDVTLIVDGAAAPLLRSGRIDAVLVGADRIARNGDTANKVGTFALALAARHAGVPLYSVAPASSFDLSIPSGDAIVVEERSPEEVRSWQGVASAPDDVAAWNPAFDVTPAELIAAHITELGVLRPPFDPAALSGAISRRASSPALTAG